MGQTTSTSGHSNTKTVELPRKEIIKYFKIQCALTLGSSVTAIASSHIDSKEFTKLLLGDVKAPEGNEKFEKAVNLLFQGCIKLGDYPFENTTGDSTVLRTDSLMSCIVLFLKKYTAFIDIDYSSLCFMLLAQPKEKKDVEKSILDEKLINEYNVFPVELSEIATLENAAPQSVVRNIDWNKTYNYFRGIDQGRYFINASDLLSLITLFLVFSHTDLPIAHEMENWDAYEAYAFSLVRNFNSNLNKSTVSKYHITHSEYKDFVSNFLPSFDSSFKLLFSRFITASSPNKKARLTREFKESKLVNGAFISIASLILSNVHNTTISPSSLIKLYSGSESGFSLRSLESKIFKWVAPTIIVVSGKRLKKKTLESNKRYEQFDLLYPKFFKNPSTSLQNWQSENDRVTYMVYVNSPWRMSNKTNFGDRSNIIISLSPKLDYYKARREESVYFNNLGFGLGFGNSQPILKNTFRKLLPGNVSLTIDPNLEFAVFRHLVSPGSDTVLSYFEGSRTIHDDFEDRFTITDLEVWGVGTDKELAEQLKNWEWEQKQAEARKSVNIRNMGEDRAFLEMVGLVGNHNGGSV